jgi:hypothetical protein
VSRSLLGRAGSAHLGQLSGVNPEEEVAASSTSQEVRYPWHSRLRSDAITADPSKWSPKYWESSIEPSLKEAAQA